MKDSLTLSAIVKDGSPELSGGQMERLLKFYLRNDGKHITITVSKKGKPRSLNQNAYMWAVVYEYIADETGHSPEEVHAAMKQLFLPRQFLPFGGHTVEMAKSTTDLSTEEFESFIERVRSFAATELSLRIPLPNEYHDPV
jgi:hypothetical protein